MSKAMDSARRVCLSARAALRAAVLGLLMLVALLVPMPALAAPAINTSATGSLTVSLSDTKGASITGSIVIYRVADLSNTESGYHVAWGSAYQSVGEAALTDMATLSSSYSKSLATQLTDVVNGQDISPTAKQALSSSGTATFSGLGVGLYLVRQVGVSAGSPVIEPFVVSIPVYDEASGQLSYDVTAKPKTNPSPHDVPDIPDKPDNPDNPDKPDNPDNPVTPDNPTTPDQPTTPSKDIPTTPSNETLPQTGQLWWPVWVLAAAGALCVIIGLASRRHES